MSFDEQPDSHCKCCYEWEQREYTQDGKLLKQELLNLKLTHERDEARDLYQRSLPALNQDLETCRQWLVEKEQLIGELMTLARHSHEARYKDGVLSDECKICSLDIRHVIHSPEAT